MTDGVNDVSDPGRGREPHAVGEADVAYARRVARKAAWKYRRAVPAEEFESEALWALFRASLRWDAGKAAAAGATWETFSRTRVYRAMVDAARVWSRHRRLARAKTYSLDAAWDFRHRRRTAEPPDGGGAWGFAEMLESGDDPASESVEYQDLVDGLSRKLPPKAGEALRRYFGTTATMRQVGERMGLSESRVTQLIGSAAAELSASPSARRAVG